MNAAEYVPGMSAGSRSRNLLLGAAYLLVLAAVAAVLATVAVSYRPYRGC